MWGLCVGFWPPLSEAKTEERPQVEAHSVPPSRTAPPAPTEDESFEQEFIPTSPRNYGVEFTGSLVKFPKFKPTSDQTYSEVYGKAGPFLAIHLDRYFKETEYGNFTTGLLSGIFFDHGSIQGQTTSLTVIPFIFDLSYRAEFITRQLWIPFIRALGGGWLFSQKSTDPTFSREGFRPTVGVTLGTDLLLDFFLWDYSKFMDQHFGINWTTITGQITYEHCPGSSESDLTHWNFSVGVRFEL